MITDYLCDLSGLEPFPVVAMLTGSGLLMMGLTLRALEWLTAPVALVHTLQAAQDREYRLPPVIVLPTLHGGCRWCGAKVRLLPDGRLSKHIVTLTTTFCDGSFTEPAALEVLENRRTP